MSVHDGQIASLGVRIREELKARTVPADPRPFGHKGIGLSEFDIAAVALKWFAEQENELREAARTLLDEAGGDGSREASSQAWMRLREALQ